MDSLTRETELRNFNSILLRLVKHGLLSEIERRKIVYSDNICEWQSALFRILLHKPLSHSSIILEVLHYFHQCSNTDTFDRESIAKIILCKLNSFNIHQSSQKETNPLLNNTVIKQVFGLLNLQDVLTCRAVCSQWNAVAEPIIRKRAKIKFGDLKPDAFVRMFADSLPNIPFSSFSITEEAGDVHRDKKLCYAKNLSSFFTHWGQHVKELHIRPVTFFNSQGDKLNLFSFHNWITASTNLSYLNIKGDNADKSSFHVSWKCLTGIKTIILKDCVVQIEPDLKLSPFKIHLENIKVFQGNKHQKWLVLNTILNFIGMKEVTLKYIGSPSSAESRQILVLTREVLNFNSLTLDNINIENINDGSNWKVDTLCLKKIPFTRKLQIQYKELVVDTGSMDLYLLQQNMQKLRIIGCSLTKFTCTQPVNLPKLKHLSVDFFGNISPVFSDFMFNLDLEDVTFDCGYLALKVDADKIPKSVKTMKLSRSVKIEGDATLILDKLILDKYSLSNSAAALSNIQAKTLVLQWVVFQNFENNDSVIMFLRRYQNLDKVLIGEFNWEDWKFEKSHLSEIVDAQSKCYEFKQGFGTAISCERFEEEMQLYTRASL